MERAGILHLGFLTRMKQSDRSEEHTSELQSPCNLVCRIIISEKHTSELQSPCNLVCRLLLEKKNIISIEGSSASVITDLLLNQIARNANFGCKVSSHLT